MAHRQTKGLVTFLIGVFLSSSLVEAKRPMTIDDVLKMKSVFATRISPDGKWILFGMRQVDLKNNMFNTDLWLIQSGGGNPIRLTYTPENESSWRWSPDGKTIAFISTRVKPAQIYLLPLEGGEASKLSNHKADIQALEWSPDGKKIAFLAQEPLSEKAKKRKAEKNDARVIDEEFRYTHLWVIDVATHKISRLTRGDFTIDSFDWSPDGQWIAYSHRPTPKVPDYFRSDISIVPARGGSSEPIIEQPGLDTDPQFSPNGQSIAFISQAGDTVWYSNLYLCEYDRRKRKIRTLSHSFDNRVGEYHWSPDGKFLYFTGPQRTNIYLWKIPARGGRPKLFTPDHGTYSGFSFSPDGKLLSFVYQTRSQPPEVFITPTAQFSPHRLTMLHPELDSFQVSIPERITWSGRDGLPIEGFLYKPIGYQPGQKVPLLTIVHGGPAGNYNDNFSMGYVYPYQVFTGKGYALLLPNPRGSGNYGYEFRKANVRDWGGEDYWDIMGGVDTVIQMGIADSSRLGILGWSYGGYMTSWIITQTDRFQAASVGAGVTNLFSFVGITDIPEFMNSYWGAWPWDDPILYRSRSPLYHIQKVKTPTLIQHGEQDLRVPIAQARELYIGLKKNGVPTQFVVYPRQSHGIRKPKLLRDAMRRNVQWMDRWILGKK